MQALESDLVYDGMFMFFETDLEIDDELVGLHVNDMCSESIVKYCQSQYIGS